MRDSFAAEVETGRLRDGNFTSQTGEKQGAFFITCPLTKTLLKIIVGCGLGWDHVSVSTEKRTPSWKELVFVKRLFFKDEECCVQFFPPESEYVNCHPNVLHIWRPHGPNIELPPKVCV